MVIVKFKLKCVLKKLKNNFESFVFHHVAFILSQTHDNTSELISRS